MENKITIEEAEAFVEKEYVGSLKANLFANVWLDEEDLYSCFHDTVAEPKGEQLIKLFDMFYSDDNIREELESAMLKAGEDYITSKIKEIAQEKSE